MPPASNDPKPKPAAPDNPAVGRLFGDPAGATQAEPFSWAKVLKRANSGALLATLGLALVIGLISFLLYLWLRKPQATTPTATTSNTTTTVPSSVLGQEGETLTVGAETTFKRKITAAGDVNIAGKLNAASPLEVSALQVAGATNLSAADIKSNLNVSGATALQGNVTVANLLTVAGNANISGNGSIGGTLTAGNLVVRNVTVGGVLTLAAHVISGGAAPQVSAGGAVGSAGTVSISGNDRAGTITINTGGAPPAGTLANVSFSSAYGSLPRVLVSPIGFNTGALQYYVTKSTTGFSVATVNAPAAGSGFSFDYLVEQ